VPDQFEQARQDRPVSRPVLPARREPAAAFKLLDVAERDRDDSVEAAAKDQQKIAERPNYFARS